MTIAFKTIMLVIAGFLLLLMGAIGLLLPVWPTTPFILAAAGCFASTPRLYAKIIRIPYLRDYLQNYKSKKGLPRRTVAGSLVFLWGMLLVWVFAAVSIWLQGGLLLIGAAVTAHILWISKPRKR